MSLVSELRRRNVFRMAVLYVVAAWLIMQVADAVIGLANLPEWIGPTILGLLAIGFPIALIFSWFYELTPEGISLEKDVQTVESSTRVTGRRMDFIVISLLCAAVIMFAYDKWSVPEPPEQSVAVLPFTNMISDPEMEYFSDGVTETLLDALAQLPDLKVPARTSAFFFKGKSIDIREIAAQLGVSNILEGSVQRDGNKIRVVAQLIEARTGFHLWSNTYDRDMNDIFEVQDDIANMVARAMQVTLTDDKDRGGSKIQTVSTTNVAAYEKYLKGVQQKNIFSHTSLRLAEMSFKEALVLDPDFYEAKLQLAETHGWQAGYGVITQSEAYERQRPLFNQLLEEDPDSAFVTMSLGFLDNPRSSYRIIRPDDVNAGSTFDLEEHLAELSAAIERTPNVPMLYNALAAHLSWADRTEEGLEWSDRGIAVDPFAWTLHSWRGVVLVRDGNLDEAEASFNRVVELKPEGPSAYEWLARISWLRQQYSQSFANYRKMMELDPLDHELPANVAYVLYAVGLKDEGDKYLQRAIAIAPDNAVVRAAELDRLLFLGDYSRAREMSENLLRDGIGSRHGAYWKTAMVYVSTMTELGKIEDALAVLEELQPGVLSPDFRPDSTNEQVLQYQAILALARSQAREGTISMLETAVPHWDEYFPRWRNDPGEVAVIEMARGHTDLAVELALEGLGSDVRGAWPYQHFSHYQELAAQPDVAARLRELDTEAKRAGEEIRSYIVEHQL